MAYLDSAGAVGLPELCGPFESLGGGSGRPARPPPVLRAVWQAQFRLLLAICAFPTARHCRWGGRTIRHTMGIRHRLLRMVGRDGALGRSHDVYAVLYLADHSGDGRVDLLSFVFAYSGVAISGASPGI